MPVRHFGTRSTVLAASAFLLGTIAAGSGAVAAAWQPVARAIGLTDPPVPSSANVLSDHETEALDGMTPQAQAELLLERAINHYQGANEQIAARVRGWRGQIDLKGRLDSLFMTAINSSDLTVRVAGVEVDIAARGLIKSAATLERLEPLAREGEQGVRVNAMWDLALLGNRGLEPERIFDILMASIHDDNQNVRYWAVEGLAFLATDAAIEPLLEVFHDDPAASVRERAACGLAQSGMFSAEQRRRAVPRLLDYADDAALDDQTRGWVYQALRDITGQSLPQDAHAWREWYQRSRRRS
jgi:HEAT repeat protein